MAEVPDPRSFFPELARRYFQFLETEFGFSLIESYGDGLEWESERTNVGVSYFAPQCDLGVSVSQGSDAFEIGEVARLNGVRWDWGAVSETAEKLSAALEAAAELIQTAGRAILRGDPCVFQALQEQRTRESAAYARKTALERMRQAGDKAWCEQDYAALVEAYEPHRADLSCFEAARLDYALKKIQESTNH